MDDRRKIIAKQHRTIQKDTSLAKGENLPADIVSHIQLIDDYGGSVGEVGVCFFKKDHTVKMLLSQ